jgi:hypothetical protein
MLSEANVKAAGPNCAQLHAYVMEHSKDKLAFPTKVDQDYFKGGCGALMLNIEFSSIFNLITLASLDVTFMRLWTLYVLYNLKRYFFNFDRKVHALTI